MQKSIYIRKNLKSNKISLMDMDNIINNINPINSNLNKRPNIFKRSNNN